MYSRQITYIAPILIILALLTIYCQTFLVASFSSYWINRSVYVGLNESMREITPGHSCQGLFDCTQLECHLSTSPSVIWIAHRSPIVTNATCSDLSKIYSFLSAFKSLISFKFFLVGTLVTIIFLITFISVSFSKNYMRIIIFTGLLVIVAEMTIIFWYASIYEYCHLINDWPPWHILLFETLIYLIFMIAIANYGFLNMRQYHLLYRNHLLIEDTI